ncbi:GNAT family N-acetyltransferase [Streptomyces avicenniae]|uniref:GNAT family N-acetyltransferase n=1 Tax=Streptomyces avicenniae TaxID=500153 RepID=UPI00069B3950|nr:GNAT family N-acetyltransferase [Streptomyces avicenniae]
MDPLLTTVRLELRPVADADADDLAALHGDPEVMRFLTGGRPEPRADVVAATLPRLRRPHPLTGRPGYWTARERAGGAYVGWFAFRPLSDEDPGVVELGYRLRRAVWGLGYATEGARALVDKGFTEWEVRRVTANTMTVNGGSRRVMEKTGLSFVGAYTGEWDEPIPGAEFGDVEYGLTRDAWEAAR